MKTQIEALRDQMIADYAEKVRAPRWYSNPSVAAEMVNEYKDTLEFIDEGEYIRIKQGKHFGGYIVNNRDDSKFEYGDLLLIDYDNSPRRTVARGNVFADKIKRISWCGVI